MPTATALRLCPQAIVLSPRMNHYAQISEQIREIYFRFTPLVEPLSLDEGFLDVTGSEGLFGSAPAIGRQIKQEIRREVGLIASVGVAPNKFLAKIASDLEKPDGFVVVDPQRVQEFLDPRPAAVCGELAVTRHSRWNVSASARSATCEGCGRICCNSTSASTARTCGNWHTARTTALSCRTGMRNPSLMKRPLLTTLRISTSSAPG